MKKSGWHFLPRLQLPDLPGRHMIILGSSVAKGEGAEAGDVGFLLTVLVGFLLLSFFFF